MSSCPRLRLMMIMIVIKTVKCIRIRVRVPALTRVWIRRLASLTTDMFSDVRSLSLTMILNNSISRMLTSIIMLTIIIRLVFRSLAINCVMLVIAIALILIVIIVLVLNLTTIRRTRSGVTVINHIDTIRVVLSTIVVAACVAVALIVCITIRTMHTVMMVCSFCGWCSYACSYAWRYLCSHCYPYSCVHSSEYVIDRIRSISIISIMLLRLMLHDH